MSISYVGRGAVKSAVNTDLKAYTQTLSVPWPTHLIDDIGFLQVVTTTDAAYSGSAPRATVNGWTEIVPARYIAGKSCCQLFWTRANSSKMANAAVVRNLPNKYTLTIACISTFRGCTYDNPPFEGVGINNILVEGPGYIRNNVERTGTASGNGRYGVVFCQSQSSYLTGIIANNYTERLDINNIGYYTADASLFMGTYNRVVNVTEHGPATYITRSDNLKKGSIYSTVNLLLIPYSSVEDGYIIELFDFYYRPLGILVAPTNVSVTSTVESTIETTIETTIQTTIETTIEATIIAGPESGIIGEYTVGFGIINSDGTEVLTTIETTVETTIPTTIETTIETTVITTLETLDQEGTVSFNFDFDMYSVGIVDLLDPNKCHITYETEFYFKPVAELNLDLRAYVKSLFYPGKKPGYEQFSQLIDFVTSDFDPSVTFLEDKSGYLESIVTVSGNPTLDVITVSDIFESLMEAATTSELVNKILDFNTEALVEITDSNLKLGIGLSANATRFSEDNNPIKISLEKQIAYTTASATNILINQHGFVTFSYCTTQSTQIIKNDQYNTSGTFIINEDTTMFEVTYLNVTNSADASRMYARFNEGTTYSFIGTSIARTSAAGLPLAGLNRVTDSTNPKSGKLHAYKAGDKWHIFQHGKGLVYTLGMVTVDGDITKIEFKSDKGGNPISGYFRVVEYNYGEKVL